VWQEYTLPVVYLLWVLILKFSWKKRLIFKIQISQLFRSGIIYLREKGKGKKAKKSGRERGVRVCDDKETF
jgi:hypothetical protein